ncbi:MAG: tRNA (adenosine(37)-N6)-threonylcarbamoyltransferase complex ATPase subunit type 1 TsaE [Flavobacteriaceae bacterium]
MKKITYTIEELRETAEQIITSAKSKIVCFYGEMGAGKTTLIKAIVQELGVTDTANSPTFGIVNEYYFENGELLGYHFDFYRLRTEVEALDLGLEEYLNQDVWMFIEWPEKIKSYLTEDNTNIYIKSIDQRTREITISKP